MTWGRRGLPGWGLASSEVLLRAYRSASSQIQRLDSADALEWGWWEAGDGFEAPEVSRLALMLPGLCRVWLIPLLLSCWGKPRPRPGAQTDRCPPGTRRL